MRSLDEDADDEVTFEADDNIELLISFLSEICGLILLTGSRPWRELASPRGSSSEERSSPVRGDKASSGHKNDDSWLDGLRDEGVLLVGATVERE